MDCRETREKLNRFVRNLLEIQEEAALRRHLNHCSDCARLARAEQLLVQDFEQMRMMAPERLLSIDQVRQAINSREERRRTTKPGVRIMQEIRSTVYSRPRMSLAAVAVVALLVASALVPVRTDYPVGYEVAFAAPLGGVVLNQENARLMLAALNLGDARLEVAGNDSSFKYRIAPLKDSAQIRKLIAAIDSLGGQQVRDVIMRARVKDLTIWELLLDSGTKKSDGMHEESYTSDRDNDITINLKDYFGDKEDFALWMPVEHPADIAQGLLMSREADRTDITILGLPINRQINDCGWNKDLENADMHARTPDGKEVTFHMYDINDVRKLEKMGYNFATMTWDTPGQVPIPGMGPELSSIQPNPFSNETAIKFMIPQAYEVRVVILDHQGHEVRVLRNCISLAGIFHVVWDGRNELGNPVDNGTYTCRFTAGDYVQTKKLVLFK